MQLGLQRALEAGFTPLITPTLVRPDIMAGTGFLGAHADEIYRLEDYIEEYQGIIAGYRCEIDDLKRELREGL